MILETIPSLNFYLFKVEDRKLFIPTVGDREWGGGEGGKGEGGNYPSHPLPSTSIPILFQTRRQGKEGAMMINKHGCPVDHPL